MSSPILQPGKYLITRESGSIRKDKPRQIADGALPILASDIRPDIFYGLSPIVPFQFWAEVRCFKPGLGFAGPAEPGLFSGGVTSIKEPPVFCFTRR
jgi:hypothetical protein